MTTNEMTKRMEAKKSAKQTSKGRFRFVILVLGLVCTTVISANANAFNFTNICMSREAGNSSTDDSVDGTKQPYFSKVELTALMWSTALSTLLSALPYSTLYARLGARTVLAGSGMASATLMLIFPAAMQLGIGAIFIIRFLQGITFAADFAAMGMICASWAPLSQVGLFISTLSIYTPLSSIIVNMISGFLCVSPLGWPSVYYIFGFFTMLVSLVWALLYTEPAASDFVKETELEKIQQGKSMTKEITTIPYKAILHSGTIWIIWLNAFAELVSGAFFIMYKPIYFRYVLGFDITETGIYTSLSLIVHIPLKIVLGHVSDRIRFLSERTKLCVFNTVGVGLPALCYVALAYAPTPYFAMFAVIANGLCFSASSGGFFKCAALCSRQYAQFVIGNVQFCKCLALFVCPALVAIFVSDVSLQYEWRIIFLFFAMLNIVANILFCLVATDQPLAFASAVVTSRADESMITARDRFSHSEPITDYGSVRRTHLNNKSGRTKG